MERHGRVENEDSTDGRQHVDEQMKHAIGREEGSHDVDAEAERGGDRDEEAVNVGVGEDAENGSAEEQNAGGENDEWTDEARDEGRRGVTIRSLA